MMATVAAFVEARADMQHGELTRSQYRRFQRKHTVKCLQAGIRQQQNALAAASNYDDLLDNGDAVVLLQSIAIHRADNSALHSRVHYAGLANVLARDAGHKSLQSFKRHRRLHQLANQFKHDGDEDDDVPQMRPKKSAPIPCEFL